ncbi:LrgB family protein [Alteromonas sediminis]|uniref:LrgB family protein n=1 Tax=Alteromonas sediminis TaxID=2259342 RepID=A0A3N5YA06_9ALTE|nr:LrgB family protein [Alteromonas sediminis]RPJ68249.1 LrgB family protein [Alteromonas sediminis]
MTELDLLKTSLESASTLPGILALFITVLLFVLFQFVHKKWLPYSLTHPLVLTALSLGAGIALLPYSVGDYQTLAALIHWSLGPATVALAIPLYQQWRAIRQQGLPMLLGIIVGGVVAPALAWWCAWLFNGPVVIQLTLLAKSITTPFAMEAATAIGGDPALAAVFVIITGIVGAMAANTVFNVFNINDKRAQGIALGTVAHAVGTAKAISDHPTTGACASMALCLNGIMTVIVLPLMF